MISVKAHFVLGMILVWLLSTLTACARHTQMQTHTQTAQAAEAKPSFGDKDTSTRNDAAATQALVPVSAPAEAEPKDPAPTTGPPASTERPSNNADDPRAVIDWLLDRSRRGR
jgi:hypothetical protein